MDSLQAARSISLSDAVSKAGPVNQATIKKTVLTTAEKRLGQAFKYLLNPFMVFMWRLGMGVWFNALPDISGRVMVIVHTGRKSGTVYRTPVNYAELDGELYCVAGFGSVSDWYRNILVHPRVQVWLPDAWWAGQIQDLSNDERRLYLMRHVLIGSGFAAFVAGINPYKVSDAQLDKLTKTYRLVRIRRKGALTGAGGPGDLAWLWQVATLFLLMRSKVRPKKS